MSIATVLSVRPTTDIVGASWLDTYNVHCTEWWLTVDGLGEAKTAVDRSDDDSDKRRGLEYKTAGPPRFI